MLDANITLFNANFPKVEMPETEAFIIAGCNAYLGECLGDKKVYSEWEENNYAYLNTNDHHGKVIEIEICLNSILNYIYSEFYARCFAIRTDNGITIKINSSQKDKYITKMNMHNQIVLGIGLFLTDQEYELLLNAERILIEGCVALKRKNNTYGIAIQIERKNNNFEVQFANTYKLKRMGNINSLAH